MKASTDWGNEELEKTDKDNNKNPTWLIVLSKKKLPY